MSERKRTIPEGLTFEALFHPRPEFPYLTDADRHPFERVEEFSSIDAWWLAELALLSYVPDESLVRTVLSGVGIETVRFIASGSTHCIVADDLVVFRGTDDLRDLLSDLDAHLLRDGPGRVHRGFKLALDAVWEEVEAAIEGRDVWLAGHSLGAALATLAGMRHARTRAVYTFGSPRVGDVELFSGRSFPVHRVVNNNDLVTRLPPPIGYRHVGDLFYLDARGALIADPDRLRRVREQLRAHGARVRENVKRWTSGDLKSIPYDSLIAHSPMHYAIHLFNHVQAQK